METVIAFIAVFGSLVFFHELGHFIFAKRAGIMVREFAIGFGPKLIGIPKGETMYTIRLLPLGGYVRMAGEEFDRIELQPGHRVGLLLNEKNEVRKLYLNQKIVHPDMIFLETEHSDFEKELSISGYDDDGEYASYAVARDASIVEQGTETRIAPEDRQFQSKSLWNRFLTIVAGPVFNFILAFFIFVLLGFMQGVPTNEPIITEVQKDGSAYQAGLQAGDRIETVNYQPIKKWTQFADIIQKNPGNELIVRVLRKNGEKMTIQVIPKTIEEAGMKYGQIGVLYSSSLEKNPIKAVTAGAEQTYFWFVKIIGLLGQLVTGQFTIDALSGPVGIYKATGEVAQHGAFNVMHWAAVLSINLGIMNLLPLPALDGGRLLFFGIEAVRGKPVDKQKEGLVHFVGIVLLMILMVVVTWNDIQRFFL